MAGDKRRWGCGARDEDARKAEGEQEMSFACACLTLGADEGEVRHISLRVVFVRLRPTTTPRYRGWRRNLFSIAVISTLHTAPTYVSLHHSYSRWAQPPLPCDTLVISAAAPIIHATRLYRILSRWGGGGVWSRRLPNVARRLHLSL